MPQTALRAVLLFALCALTACDCGGGTGSVTAGFRTSATELDFGKAFEGTEVTRQLELESTGRGDVTVAASATGPFRVAQSIVVPGGATVSLDVTFVAPEGAAEGTLTLSARGESFDVSLRGRGVRPLSCVPSAQCRIATFSLDTERCEEAVAGDGASCTPEELCLENGVCRSGTCVGTARSCDDGNACTQDACAPDRGCIHVDTSSACPRPANPCEAATCDPLKGCGARTVGDGNVCGSVDCVTAHLCASGVCLALPTPEDFLCAPATPCQGEGHCSSGKCVRPDAGVMNPRWFLEVGAPVEPVAPAPGRMLGLNGNLYFSACGLSSQDGGCAVTSYTGNSLFHRFDSPSATLATLHAVSERGAVVEEGGALQSIAVSNGALQWSVPLTDLAPVEDGGTVVLPRGAVVVDRDAGTTLVALSSLVADPQGDAGERLPTDGVVLARLDADGGVAESELVADAGFGSVIARSSAGAEWLYGSERAFSRVPVDGGFEWQALGTFAGDGTLSASGAGAVFGASWLLTADGGVVGLLNAGEGPVGYEALSANEMGFTFYRPPSSPALSVRAFSTVDGVELWNRDVLPPELPGNVVEAALTGGFLSGGIAVLTQAESTSGARLELQLFLSGERLMQCPLPEGVRAYAATFEQGMLYVLVERGGLWRLEAYDLAGMPLASAGWPRTSGVSGQRSAR